MENNTPVKYNMNIPWKKVLANQIAIKYNNQLNKNIIISGNNPQHVLESKLLYW